MQVQLDFILTQVSKCMTSGRAIGDRGETTDIP